MTVNERAVNWVLGLLAAVVLAFGLGCGGSGGGGSAILGTKVQVLDQSGAPVAGAYVLLHDQDGTVTDSRLTQASGVADFGYTGHDRATMTVAYAETRGSLYTIQSFIDIPVSQLLLNTVHVLRPSEKVGTITVNTAGTDFNDVFLQPFFEQGTGPFSVDLYPEMLQEDILGETSLTVLALGFAYDSKQDGFGSTLDFAKYGFLTDQSGADTTITVTLDKVPALVPFESDQPVNLVAVEATRGSLAFALGAWVDFTETDTEGSFPVANDTPTGSVFMVDAVRNNLVHGENGWTDTGVWARARRLTAPSETSPISVDMPKLSLSQVSCSETGILTWTPGGTGNRNLTALLLSFMGSANKSTEGKLVNWAIFMDPSTTSWDIHFLDLPSEVEAWFEGCELAMVDVNTAHMNIASNFDQLVGGYLLSASLSPLLSIEAEAAWQAVIFVGSTKNDASLPPDEKAFLQTKKQLLFYHK